MKINKEKIKKLKGSKRFLMLFAFGIVFMSISVLGVWYVSWTASSGYVVSSSFPIAFSVSTFTMDDVVSGDAIILKQDGLGFFNDGIIELPFVINYVTTRTDVLTDDCTDFENDASVEVKFMGVLVNDGDLINLPIGDGFVHVNTELAPFTCAQTIETEVTLTPQ